jgi:hypothetical protein
MSKYKRPYIAKVPDEAYRIDVLVQDKSAPLGVSSFQIRWLGIVAYHIPEFAPLDAPSPRSYAVSL